MCVCAWVCGRRWGARGINLLSAGVSVSLAFLYSLWCSYKWHRYQGKWFNNSSVTRVSMDVRLPRRHIILGSDKAFIPPHCQHFLGQRFLWPPLKHTPPYSQISGNIEMTYKKSKIFCGYNNKWIDVVLSLDVTSKTVPLSMYFLSGQCSQDNENAVHKPLSDPFMEICGGVKAVLVCGGERMTQRG